MLLHRILPSSSHVESGRVSPEGVKWSIPWNYWFISLDVDEGPQKGWSDRHLFVTLCLN